MTGFGGTVGRLMGVLALVFAAVVWVAPGASGFGQGGVPLGAHDGSISADGRVLVFEDLFFPPYNGATDNVAMRDTQTGYATPVNRFDGPDGFATGQAHFPSVTPDGRYVVFASRAHLTAGEPGDSAFDVYVRDLLTGTTTLVSRATGAAGAKANASTNFSPLHPAISANGRYVAWETDATNLSVFDTDTIPDVYVRDLQANTTALVSDSTGLAPKNPGGSSQPSVSADGQLIAFKSASRLTPDDTVDIGTDVYVRDMSSGAYTLVSRASGAAGAVSNGSSFVPAISADGQSVAFVSNATNLDVDDADSRWDVYLRDLGSDATVLVSRASGVSGAKSNGEVFSETRGPSISADGRFVSFENTGSNLSPDDADSTIDIFVRDLDSATTTLASRASGAAGTKAQDSALGGALSSDGRFITFSTLLPQDPSRQLYVRDLQMLETYLEGRGLQGYPRPKAATPLYVPLVPSYAPCTSPDRVHASPLTYGSCSAADATSALLTTGTPDANGQSAKLRGDVRLTSFGFDLGIQVNVTDVRNASDLSDYTGELRLNATVRMTDQNSPLRGDRNGPATVGDIEFGPSVPCAANTDATVGSTCSINTSVNTLIPNSLRSGYRANMELGEVRLDDGGADGDGDTTGDNAPFLGQGVFVP
jgi:Tol biopolymer transport system component